MEAETPRFQMQFAHIEALKKTALLDSEPEPVFDSLTALASKALNVPVALLSLVDEDRQFFKSALGLPEPWASRRETPHSHSFCKHVALRNDALIITDARTVDLVKDNLAVTELGVIGYAGMPVRDEEGMAIGAFCAISPEPRDWTPDELHTLKLLADQASSEIALRARSRQLGFDLANLRAAEELRQQMARLDRQDLRSPISAMLLSIDAVAYSGPVNEAQQECLASAKSSGRAVLDILDRMTDISDIDHLGAGALSITECHPSDLLSRAVAQIVTLAELRNAQIEIDDSASLPEVRADRGKVARVLANLLSNAIKFSAEGSSIQLAARVVENGQHAVVFSVTDPGEGIANADLDKLFVESVRSEGGVPGRRSTGLGLLFCQRVVEAHGGRIWVESRLGVGSTFAFSLPLAV
jgi:signal transduction histidine kinase